MLEKIKGRIERITYSNQETGYTVARVKVQGKTELVTVVGNLISPMPGEVLSMKGEWANHPKYGEQFKVVYYESTVPATITGIRKYLSSGLIKGIGPVMADRIVKKFGMDTLDIIEGQIDRLEEVEGIGKKRIEMISQAWTEQKEIREIMLFLQSNGISSAYASRIYKHYGDRSIAVVRENPYRMAMDIFGIGFITADKIAEQLGFSKESPLRAEAGILFLLNRMADEGHVYYPHELLLEKCQKVLEIESAIVTNALNKLIVSQKVVSETLHDNTGDLNKNQKAIYLTQFYLCEKRIAERIKLLAVTPKSVRSGEVEKAVAWVQKELSIQLAANQLEAIRNAVDKKVLILTGGPGTGKTTVINAILKIFNTMGARCLLAAPTGRAAKRMSESTGFPAKTLHRLLEFSFQSGGFQKNEEKPLNCQVLIVDEASMIDTVLMYHLMKAVPLTASFILVGDVNQLPSVGPGNVLKDMIASGTLPVTTLTEIFRQAAESLIIVNAHRINQGNFPLLPANDNSESISDFYFIRQEDPEKVLKIILDLACKRIPKRFGFDPVDEIQVLTPMHRGTLGASNLNHLLQETLNPKNSTMIGGARSLKIGDKVMQLRNNYDKKVFNGDMGRIRQIDTESQQILVLYDDRTVAYDFSEIDEITLSYAISVHKSQGSEYPVVIIPVVTQHYILLQRNLIYTAITRAKKLAVLVGTWKALAIGIKNDKTQKRYTLLEERLKALLK